MSTTATLAAFAAALAVVFAASTAVGAAVGPVGPARTAEPSTEQSPPLTGSDGAHGSTHTP